MIPIKIREALRQVYSKKAYFVLTTIFSLGIFSLNALFGNYKLLFYDFSFKLLIGLIVGAHS
ncbi:MAG: hypothetical protein AABX05_05705, partial [Nanoarchaeota archaeon]